MASAPPPRTSTNETPIHPAAPIRRRPAHRRVGTVRDARDRRGHDDPPRLPHRHRHGMFVGSAMLADPGSGDGARARADDER